MAAAIPGGEGLSYYNARWYDARLGRFTQADIIVPNPGNPQALNRYTYVYNNPLRFMDPTGRCPEDGPDVCAMGTVGANTLTIDTVAVVSYATTAPQQTYIGPSATPITAYGLRDDGVLLEYKIDTSVHRQQVNVVPGTEMRHSYLAPTPFGPLPLNLATEGRQVTTYPLFGGTAIDHSSYVKIDSSIGSGLQAGVTTGGTNGVYGRVGFQGGNIKLTLGTGEGSVTLRAGQHGAGVKYKFGESYLFATNAAYLKDIGGVHGFTAAHAPEGSYLANMGVVRGFWGRKGWVPGYRSLLTKLWFSPLRYQQKDQTTQ